MGAALVVIQAAVFAWMEGTVGHSANVEFRAAGEEKLAFDSRPGVDVFRNFGDRAG